MASHGAHSTHPPPATYYCTQSYPSGQALLSLITPRVRAAISRRHAGTPGAGIEE